MKIGLKEITRFKDIIGEMRKISSKKNAKITTQK